MLVKFERFASLFCVVSITIISFLLAGGAVVSYDGDKAGIKVISVKLVAPVPGRNMTAAYVTLINESDEVDRLISADFPIAKRVEIHTMEIDDGVMKMRELENGLEITRGQALIMKPGGDHIMIFGLEEVPAVGETMPVTLVFEKTGSVEISAEVVSLKDLLN